MENERKIQAKLPIFNLMKIILFFRWAQPIYTQCEAAALTAANTNAMTTG